MPINKITKLDLEVLKANVYDEFNALDLYQRIATQSAIYPGQGTPLGLVYVALKGAGEAGEFAEHVGKAMRDDGFIPVDEMLDNETGHEITVGGLMGMLTLERHALLVKEIGDQLWYLSAKCNELGIKLSDAAVVNIEKLLDRTERDALRGSGDIR